MSTTVEWIVLAVGVSGILIGTLALCARYVGGWGNLRARATNGPPVPTSYGLGAFALTALLVAIVNPVDESSGIVAVPPILFGIAGVALALTLTRNQNRNRNRNRRTE